MDVVPRTEPCFGFFFGGGGGGMAPLEFGKKKEISIYIGTNLEFLFNKIIPRLP